uniref:Uncharacterized protein n=1 Tax=Rhizophora mucronata TaxID=61149 RepID=A0A2P2J7J1_RHIMU
MEENTTDNQASIIIRSKFSQNKP